VDAFATARLAEGIPTERAVSTSVMRHELAAVLEDDGSPELVLDLVRDGSDDPAVRVGVDWSRAELETLLGGTGGNIVTLTFDRYDLEGLLDDVEAHGMRRRAAIVAVAVGGALGSTATIANAMPSTADTAGAPAAASSSSSEAPANDHEGLGIQMPALEGGLLAGGAVLAIASATLVTRRAARV
jgi:hypothetical protein